MVIEMEKEGISFLVEKLISDIEKSCDSNEIPVGAMVINGNGEVISECFNNRQSSKNVLGHAEILAIMEAERKIGDWRLNGYSMVVSLKPCDMCAMVIHEARLDRVFYLLDKQCCSKYDDLYLNYERIEGLCDLEKKYSKLLTDFFVNKR